MTSLHDLIAQYGTLPNPPAVGDKVLFERGYDSGSCSINLGEVVQIRPEGDFKQPSAVVKGIHTFFPDGSNQPHRGRTPWSFPVNHFTKPIAQRLAEQAERWEKLAVEARTWIGTFDQR